jgi:RimJ/RimL family protein N-acetyltransferase
VNLEPLFGLRIRTPRLELRFPSDTELVELYELAAAGIHPPEEMPFGVAWTDDLTQESFLAYHRSLRERWTPEAWTLDLGTWVDGALAGVQGIGAETYAENRTIGTGSWLGTRFQGRGVGTEMRTAVVELAFRELGAAAVVSSAFEANAASRRVSEKLGYRVVGHETMSPRGVPEPHLKLQLDRSEWRGAPFPVEVEGVEPCLPLFGAAQPRA